MTKILKSKTAIWWKTFETADAARPRLFFPEVFCNTSFRDVKDELAAYQFNLNKFSEDTAFCDKLKPRLVELERINAGIWCEQCFYFQKGACICEVAENSYKFEKKNGKVVFCFVFRERENERR